MDKRNAGNYPDKIYLVFPCTEVNNKFNTLCIPRKSVLRYDRDYIRGQLNILIFVRVVPRIKIISTDKQGEMQYEKTAWKTSYAPNKRQGTAPTAYLTVY